MRFLRRFIRRLWLHCRPPREASARVTRPRPMITKSLRPTGLSLHLLYERSTIQPPHVRLDILGGFKADADRHVIVRSPTSPEWPEYDCQYRVVEGVAEQVGCEMPGYLEDFDRETFAGLADYAKFKLAGTVYRKVPKDEIRTWVERRSFSV